MTAVLLLPGIILPASVRYAPLLAEFRDVNAHVLDLVNCDMPQRDRVVKPKVITA